MKKKSLVLAVLTALLCLCLTACGSNGEDAVQTWVLANSSTEGTITNYFAEQFAQELDRLSDGTIKLEIYTNSSLGGDTEILESCEVGDIPFVAQSPAPQVSYMPQLSLFDLPCAHSDIEEIHAILDDENFSSKVNAIYLNHGYRLLGIADQNFRVMTSNKEIQSVSDLKGVKIRTMENANHIAFWKALGATPTPMTFSEVYLGLSQGTIDAQENSYEINVSSKLYEAQKYIIQTNHLPDLITLIVSEQFFEGLTEEQQAIVQEAADIAKDAARTEAAARAEDRIATMEEYGCVFVPLTDELWDAMQETSAGVYDDIRAIVNDDELFDAYAGTAAQ